jgi:hypothetical protein
MLYSYKRKKTINSSDHPGHEISFLLLLLFHYYYYYYYYYYRDSAADIASGYGLDGPGGGGFESRQGQDMLLSTSLKLVLGPNQSCIQWVPAALAPGVNWPVHETDHSASTSPVVMNTWISTSTPSHFCLIS